MENNIEVQKAIEDLAYIKRAIEQSQKDCETNSDVRMTVTKTYRLLNSTIFIMASLLFAVELFYGNINTKYLLASVSNSSVRISSMFETGVFLALLLLALYIIVYEASRKAGKEFNYYLAKNFAYLKNLSLFSDLLVKYIIFCLIIIAGRPDWIAPVLFFFLGDYLINGRVLYLPVRIGLICGATCFIAGFIQIAFASALLIWPLLMLAFASLLSIVWTNSTYKNSNTNKA